MKENSIGRKIGRVIISLLMVLLIIFTTVSNIAYQNFAGMVKKMVVKPKVDVSQEEITEIMEQNERLAEQVEGEGIVLLQNAGNTLPLSEDISKVNIFGWSSTQWIGSGSGSGRVNAVNTTLLDAFKAAGISYNEELISMYQDFLGERPYFSEGSLNSHDYEFCRLYEPSVSDKSYYSEELLVNAREYSNTAIVVIGRISGESIDCPKEQYKVLEKDGAIVTDTTRTYLDLSEEEEELLTYVGENFENVVVLINSTNTMALGPIETIAGVDACMLVGGTGMNAATAVPKVLYGEINPSGRTADTYAYDFSTAPVYANVGIDGVGIYTNGSGLYPADGTKNGNVGTSELYEGVSYVDYVENIYVGYRWYETADAENFWHNVSNEYGTGYEGVVQYPFGYGLSYTDFSWEIVDRVPADHSNITRDTEISITVKVTNTGEMAGKDVVELYYTAPYTKGEIEKASTVLCAFAKTEILAPGESEEVVLAFTVDDMASYDCYDANKNGFSGYELEAGDYEIALKKNAHETIHGEDSTATYLVAEDILCDTDLKTGNIVDNKFTGGDAMDGVSVDGSDSGANIQYLTRADFESTFPYERKENRAMTENVVALNLYTEEMANAWMNDEDEPVVTGKDSGLMLRDNGVITELGYQLGADYNDKQWDAVLDQMTQEEMENLVLHGYVSSNAVDSIEKPLTKEVDGPAQIGSFNQPVYGTGFPNTTVLAQTWNDALSYEMGQGIGMEAAVLGYDGWYAPSTNMHRSPFGGRNYEYYSEDGCLSGIMCAKTIEGSMDAGVFCYIKHFIVYDQDTNRDSLYTWLTEQSLREIYLKPFQIAVEKAGATGIMTAYNRIGAVWAGGSSALLQGILRGEWNFYGSIITDYCDHHEYMNMDQALRAGGTLWMDGMFPGSLKYETESNSYMQALREASKGVIYIWLNANVRNAEYVNANEGAFVKPIKTEGINFIKIIIVILDLVTILLAALWIFSIVKRVKRRKTAAG